MRDLNYDLKLMTQHNRDGSYAAQANRARMLSQIATELYALGFKKMRAQDLKGRHVERLVHAWQDRGLATGTLKNRMAALRWWAEKIGKPSMIARDNSHYGIPDRQYVTNTSKARAVEETALALVRDPHVRMSLELQRVFGLRREEAMKIQPSYADRGDTLVLKDSWTKGGKPREIPIRTAAQREVLDRAHRLASTGSLIPPQRSYVQQLKIYERHTANAGLSKLHGLRHAYAQQRYAELTGRLAPAAGGPTSKELTPEAKRQDLEVRLLISKELGHEREQITAVYLGR
jgi:site-specific recombinase XerC